MSKKVMFTISSLNYMHYSLNVRKSFLKYNPDWDFVIFMMDELASPESLKMLSDLTNDGIDIRSFLEVKNLVPHYPIEEMLNRYSVLEVNTAIKPFCIEYLIKSGYDKVIYIDPDIQFYAPITKLDKLLDNYDIVLTPHMMHPYPEDGKQQECQTIMMAGMYNCGFFACKNTENSLNCVRFWQQKLRHKCYVDIPAALFTDQKWADWFPALFDKVYIFKDYGHNTAYWNLHERTVTNRHGKWYSNDDELVFYHFSGLNRKDMELISKYQNRYRLSDRKLDLKKLFVNYLDNVNANRADDFVKFSYFGTTVGHTNYVIPNSARRLVFDKQQAFVHNLKDAMQSIKIYAQAEKEPIPKDINFESGYGINVIGYLYDMHSLGVVMRAFVDDLMASGIPFSLYVLESGSAKIPESEHEKYKSFVTNEINYPVNLFVVNADQVENVYNMNPDLFRGKYNIANWWWEFENGFDAYKQMSRYVDKVIVCTKHAQNGISNTIKDIPVEIFRYPYRSYQDSLIDVKDVRKKYKLNQKDYLFFFNFDYNSSYDRKNPEAILYAFADALPTQKDAKLVVKTSNLSKHKSEHAKFIEIATKLKIKDRIVVIDEFLSKQDMMSLINACEAYISLHHAEGLGLGMMEAMNLGKPVIATEYSGNIDFMNDENSLLVPAKVVSAKIDFPHYKNVTVWGEPDIKKASEYIKKLYKNHDFGYKIGQKAKEYINQTFSLMVFDKDIYKLMLSAQINNHTEPMKFKNAKTCNKIFYSQKQDMNSITRKYLCGLYKTKHFRQYKCKKHYILGIQYHITKDN